MSEWISVEERLPEYDEKVLIWTGRTTVRGYRSHTDKQGEHYKLNWPSNDAANVTHWMPLPEPPTE